MGANDLGIAADSAILGVLSSFVLLLRRASMTKLAQSDLPATISLDPEAAAALDAALDDLQSGRAVDRKALLARYPQLDGALAALNHLFAEPVTITHCPPPAEPLDPTTPPSDGIAAGTSAKRVCLPGYE